MKRVISTDLFNNGSSTTVAMNNLPKSKYNLANSLDCALDKGDSGNINRNILDTNSSAESVKFW